MSWPIVALIALVALAVGLFAGYLYRKNGMEKKIGQTEEFCANMLAQSLIEQAVRLNLGLGERDKITADLLEQVTGIYIVADTAYPDADDFYPAIGRWYA
ncbi:MAG: hypothetical protein IJI26_06135, partial [Clostridia bacterium]|nr:hypothetical protein [Clostridia bacterium]